MAPVSFPVLRDRENVPHVLPVVGPGMSKPSVKTRWSDLTIYGKEKKTRSHNAIQQIPTANILPQKENQSPWIDHHGSESRAIPITKHAWSNSDVWGTVRDGNTNTTHQLLRETTSCLWVPKYSTFYICFPRHVFNGIKSLEILQTDYKKWLKEFQ